MGGVPMMAGGAGGGAGGKGIERRDFMGRANKDKNKDEEFLKRADYVVEDEQTWATSSGGAKDEAEEPTWVPAPGAQSADEEPTWVPAPGAEPEEK